jgi:hypothetical protein
MSIDEKVEYLYSSGRITALEYRIFKCGCGAEYEKLLEKVFEEKIDEDLEAMKIPPLRIKGGTIDELNADLKRILEGPKNEEKILSDS